MSLPKSAYSAQVTFDEVDLYAFIVGGASAATVADMAHDGELHSHVGGLMVTSHGVGVSVEFGTVTIRVVSNANRDFVAAEVTFTDGWLPHSGQPDGWYHVATLPNPTSEVWFGDPANHPAMSDVTGQPTELTDMLRLTVPVGGLWTIRGLSDGGVVKAISVSHAP